ncbi:acyltransferase family protein [Fibrella aquatilis]|uniref:Acyltransferase 3 domain-containing protein n=1 Tax=Fibrella aquatilis TaxID=2817059 RepID=A0A939JZI5_9BACT|nr:acyltransferase family protein [Fibrella aquatilis]MBO0931448.1 hypothetical protein [Fibrella aquatilis]
MRDNYTTIDYIKALLVGGMVLGHSFQLLGTIIPGNRISQLCYAYTAFGNLIAFAGFFFCFGYAYCAAYFAKSRAAVQGKLARTAAVLLLAYYVSALMATIFLPSRTGIVNPLTMSRIVDVLLLSDIALYSEFLLSFFILTLATLLFFEPLKRLSYSPWGMRLAGAGAVLSSLVIPADFSPSPWLALLIGSREVTAFPVVQYLVFFVAGMYFARFGTRWDSRVALVSALGSGAFVGYYALHHEFPSRFPPSIFWLCGSWGFLYAVYLLVGHWIRRGWQSSALQLMARNTLVFLVLSNPLLFALSTKLKLQPLPSVMVGVLVLLGCFFVVKIVRQPVRETVQVEEHEEVSSGQWQ